MGRAMRFALLLLTVLLACDADGDGYGNGRDCDDDDPTIHPDAVEYCDEVDNDCDGDTDEPDAMDALPWWVDSDSDGFGDPERLAKACEHPSGWVDNDADCDDDNAAVNPDEEEVPGDGIDNDCNPDTQD